MPYFDNLIGRLTPAPTTPAPTAPAPATPAPAQPPAQQNLPPELIGPAGPGFWSDAVLALMRASVSPERQAEIERQNKLRRGLEQIDEQFAGFNDDFYNERRKSYFDFATPQLATQYNDAYRNLMAALSRGGMLRSSEGSRRFGRLAGDYDLQKQQILTRADELANQSRRSIESGRNALVQDLNATNDPAAAQAAAHARAAIERQQQSFSPLAGVFGNVTSGLADYNTAFEDARLRRQLGVPTSSTDIFSQGSQSVNFG